MNRFFIGLGSNLDSPLSQLKSAIESLKRLQTIDTIKISDFYSSPPMGPQDQPDYINAVAELYSSLNAEQLLDELQHIENQQGRERKQRWGARTLDLDILLCGNEVVKTERLTIPHTGLSQRNFVLYPLKDLVGDDFEVPTLGAMSQLLVDCPMVGIKRLIEV